MVGTARAQLASVDGFEPGQQLKADELFKVGDFVDVAGTSIGKGFQGASGLVVEEGSNVLVCSV